MKKLMFITSLTLSHLFGLAYATTTTQLEETVSIQCSSCLKVAKHMQSLSEDKNLESIIYRSEGFVFRLALEVSSDNAFNVLVEEEKKVGRLLSINEAKSFLLQ